MDAFYNLVNTFTLLVFPNYYISLVNQALPISTKMWTLDRLFKIIIKKMIFFL